MLKLSNILVYGVPTEMWLCHVMTCMVEHNSTSWSFFLARFSNVIIYPGALAIVSKAETVLDIWRQESYTAGLDEKGSANIILAMWYWFVSFWTQTIPWLTENMYFSASTQTVYSVLSKMSSAVYDNYIKCHKIYTVVLKLVLDTRGIISRFHACDHK